MQLSDAFITSIVEQFFAEKARIESEQFDWTIPEPPPNPPAYGDNALVWRESVSHYDNSPRISIEELRDDLPDRLISYIQAPVQKDHPMLLTLVSAGGGKTHAGVLAAQWAARNGYRVLWCAPNHSLLPELAALQDEVGLIFDPSLWLHFQSITNEEYCRYSKAQHSWLKRAYPAKNLCQQLCSLDGWIHQCPYRCQAKSKHPIVFGMHQHLTTGLLLSDFDVVIIDELPLNAFKNERLIPVESIHLDGDASKSIRLLTDTLTLISKACQKNEFYSGRKLFDIIGPILEDAYQEIAVVENPIPVVPMIHSPFEIEQTPYWYIMDLLFLSLKEHKAWEMLWPNWAERIKVSSQGLHLLDRNKPWSKLPQKTIVLDATAEPALYAQLFGSYKTQEREIEVETYSEEYDTTEPETKTITEEVWIPRQMSVYQPRIDRKGRIYQIVARMNGKRSLQDKHGKFTPNAQKLIEQAKLIAKRYEGKGRVCVVCHMLMEQQFADIFGAENVMHFGAVRGSNKLEKGLACLIVAGTPAPGPFHVIDIATALDKNRIEPFVYSEHMRSAYTEQECEYLITPELREEQEGLSPFRRVRGYWEDWQLQAIHEQLSKAELEQTLHRARPNSQDVDVWILSALPTNEMVDGIWDEPPFAPAPFNWQEWRLIEPWLDEKWELGGLVGRNEIAALLGISAKWVASRKLLQAVITIQPDRWQWYYDPNHTNKNGPRVLCLLPVVFG